MNSIFDSSTGTDIFDGRLSNETFQDRENHGSFSDIFRQSRALCAAGCAAAQLYLVFIASPAFLLRRRPLGWKSKARMLVIVRSHPLRQGASPAMAELSETAQTMQFCAWLPEAGLCRTAGKDSAFLDRYE